MANKTAPRIVGNTTDDGRVALGLSEVAVLLGADYETVAKACDSGRLPSFSLNGGKRLVTVEAFQRFTGQVATPAPPQSTEPLMFNDELSGYQNVPAEPGGEHSLAEPITTHAEREQQVEAARRAAMTPGEVDAERDAEERDYQAMIAEWARRDRERIAAEADARIRQQADEVARMDAEAAAWRAEGRAVPDSGWGKNCHEVSSWPYKYATRTEYAARYFSNGTVRHTPLDEDHEDLAGWMLWAWQDGYANGGPEVAEERAREKVAQSRTGYDPYTAANADRPAVLNRFTGEWEEAPSASAAARPLVSRPSAPVPAAKVETPIEDHPRWQTYRDTILRIVRDGEGLPPLTGRQLLAEARERGAVGMSGRRQQQVLARLVDTDVLAKTEAGSAFTYALSESLRPSEDAETDAATDTD